MEGGCEYVEDSRQGVVLSLVFRRGVKTPRLERTACYEMLHKVSDFL
jgi:hypothetical protein